jgi:hypothetical protein
VRPATGRRASGSDHFSSRATALQQEPEHGEIGEQIGLEDATQIGLDIVRRVVAAGGLAGVTLGLADLGEGEAAAVVDEQRREFEQTLVDRAELAPEGWSCVYSSPMTWKQIAVLQPSSYSASDLSFIVRRVLELTYTSHSMAPFARDLGYAGPPFVWDEDRRAQLRAELDAWYAHAYGLTRDELRYILDPAAVRGAGYPSETFRVLKTNEIRRLGEYRTARLVLQAWDRLHGGELAA